MNCPALTKMIETNAAHLEWVKQQRLHLYEEANLLCYQVHVKFRNPFTDFMNSYPWSQQQAQLLAQQQQNIAGR